MNNAKLELNFTVENIKAIPLPTERATYHDTNRQSVGLQLRVTPTGVKTFCIFRRISGGKPERISIGRFPITTLDQARRRAAEINAEISTGSNPAEVKRARRAEKRFSDLFAEYLERHAKVKKSSWKDDRQRYKQYLEKIIGNEKLSDIDRTKIARIHSDITLSGHTTVANRVLALISGVFGWAINAGLAESNPATGIHRNREESRDRFLQADELPHFFAAIDAEPDQTMRDYFLISLLTGARRANVLSMRWEDINFERAEWRIELTKNGTPQTVTLSPEAVEILFARIPEQEQIYVFPGNGKTGHIVEPKFAWQRILDSANIKNLRIHDLRRTLGSWQAKSGSSLVVIGKSLNHKNIATTAIYARLDLDPVRESVNAATNAILIAGRGKTENQY